MDIFEQADAFTPNRAVLQEEEEAATSSSAKYLRSAVCVWNKRLLQQLYPKGVSCKTMVMATCPTSCALLNAVPGKQLLGSVLAPGVSLAGNSLSLGAAQGQPLPSDNVCCIYALPQSAGFESGDGVLLVCCQYSVPRERAPAWARSVLGQVSYKYGLFLGAMSAEQFRGEGDASQEELIFALRTPAACERLQPPGQGAQFPLLPSGTVVGGLPAALLSHCHVRGQAAELLVTVEMVQEGRAARVEALAGAVGTALRNQNAVAAAEALGAKAVVAGAQKALNLSAHASDVYA